MNKSPEFLEAAKKALKEIYLHRRNASVSEDFDDRVLRRIRQEEAETRSRWAAFEFQEIIWRILPMPAACALAMLLFGTFSAQAIEAVVLEQMVGDPSGMILSFHR